MKPILSLTLSTQRAQVALVLPPAEASGEGGSAPGPLRPFFRENSEARRHSEWLLTEIADLMDHEKLDFKDLEGIAVDIGPGSFTGIRVGFQTAQSFAYAHDLPVFTASSLDILSYGFSQEVRVFALINAFRNLIYVRDSKGDGAPEVLGVEEMVSRITAAGPCLLVGDAYAKLEELRQGLAPIESHLAFPSENQFPSAVTLAEMAASALHQTSSSQKTLWTKDWKSISPLYLRGSEAEEKLRLK